MLLIDTTQAGLAFRVECDGPDGLGEGCDARGPVVPALSRDDAAAVEHAVRASGFRPYVKDGLGGYHRCFACDSRGA